MGNFKIAKSGVMMVNGELRAANIKSVKLRHGGVVEYEVDGIGVMENIVTYADRAAFERCEPSKMLCYATTKVEWADGGVKVWSLKDNGFVCEVMKPDFVLKDSIFYPELEPGQYLSRAECVKNSIYTQILDDGTEVVRMGIKRKIALTQEQRDFLNDVLVPTLKMARDLNISLLLDDCDVLRAFNDKEFTDLQYMDCDKEDSVTVNDMEKVWQSTMLSYISGETAIYDNE